MPPEDHVVKKFIRENGFGTLVSQAEGKLWATHIPMMLSADETKLSAHISRGNKSWRSFESSPEVMAIFQGPHAYVSSSWYNHENVPTWNYIAVHVYGTIRLIEGEELFQSLKNLTDHYEQSVEKPVAVERMSPGYVESQMKGVAGLEISITSMEATYKLSQNRDDVNYQNVIDALEKRDHGSKQVAAEMKNINRKPKS